MACRRLSKNRSRSASGLKAGWPTWSSSVFAHMLPSCKHTKRYGQHTMNVNHVPWETIGFHWFFLHIHVGCLEGNAIISIVGCHGSCQCRTWCRRAKLSAFRAIFSSCPAWLCIVDIAMFKMNLYNVYITMVYIILYYYIYSIYIYWIVDLNLYYVIFNVANYPGSSKWSPKFNSTVAPQRVTKPAIEIDAVWSLRWSIGLVSSPLIVITIWFSMKTYYHL